MSACLRFVAVIDAGLQLLARLLAWLLPVVVVLAAAVVILRYVVQTGYPWLSESYVWLHGAIFMLAMAGVLAWDAHVRVDVFYRFFSQRGRALANLFGVVLLLWPSMYVIGTLSLPIVERSWRIAERSPTPDGLPILYLIKAIVPLACLLISLQGLVIFVRSLAVLSDERRWGHLIPARDNAETTGDVHA